MGTDLLMYPCIMLILWPKPPKIKPVSPPTFLAVDTSQILCSLSNLFFLNAGLLLIIFLMYQMQKYK